MTSAAPTSSAAPLERWSELVLPKEHGSWSLALEPVVFALIVAPSLAGGMFALAVIAAFFARRPLRLALFEHRPERRRAARQALVACAAASVLATAAAVVVGGFGWLAWLVPAAAAGAVFLAFDLRKSGREQAAEVAGAFAFACLPAAFAALAGATPAAAVALTLVMLARAVPTVLTVRAAVRARKTGEWRTAPAVVSSLLAAVVVGVLAADGRAPVVAAVFAALLAVRSLALLVYPRVRLRATTLGIVEAVLGGTFVLVVATAWSLAGFL